MGCIHIEAVFKAPGWGCRTSRYYGTSVDTQISVMAEARDELQQLVFDGRFVMYQKQPRRLLMADLGPYSDEVCANAIESFQERLMEADNLKST